MVRKVVQFSLHSSYNSISNSAHSLSFAGSVTVEIAYVCQLFSKISIAEHNRYLAD